MHREGALGRSTGKTHRVDALGRSTGETHREDALGRSTGKIFDFSKSTKFSIFFLLKTCLIF